MRIKPNCGISTGAVCHRPGVPVEWPDDAEAVRYVLGGMAVKVDDDGEAVELTDADRALVGPPPAVEPEPENPAPAKPKRGRPAKPKAAESGAGELTADQSGD
jgi:hypothetical protein